MQRLRLSAQLGSGLTGSSQGGPPRLHHGERLILPSAFVPTKESANISFHNLAREDGAGDRHRRE